MSAACSAEDSFAGNACWYLKASTQYLLWWPPLVSSPATSVNRNHLYMYHFLLAGRLINCRPFAGRLINEESDRLLIAHFCEVSIV